jgi:hypothetical protein
LPGRPRFVRPAALAGSSLVFVTGLASSQTVT